MSLAIDHLVVAARTLEEGAAWVASRLGVGPAGGGRHPLMGTHNRLLGLGGEAFLEVIAVDPAAPAPARPRWFSLDAPETRERLGRGAALVHWVVSTDDVVRDAKAAPFDLGEVIAVTRGDYRWRITVPRDGGLPAEGVFPTLIQWDGPRPGPSLSDSGCRLDSIALSHPRAGAILSALRAMGLPRAEPVTAADAAPGLAARFRVSGRPAGLP